MRRLPERCDTSPLRGRDVLCSTFITHQPLRSVNGVLLSTALTEPNRCRVARRDLCAPRSRGIMTVLNCTEDYGRRLLPLCPHLCIF